MANYTPPRGFAVALDMATPASSARGFAVALPLGAVAGVVANADAYAVFAGTTHNQPAPGVLANDTDDSGTGLTALLDTGPANGALVLQSDGSFAYTPDGGFTGVDTWQYKAKNGDGDEATATVTMTVSLPAVQRYEQTGAALPWSASLQPLRRAVRALFGLSTRVRQHADLPFGRAADVHGAAVLPWQRSARARHQAGLPWGRAAAVARHAALLPVGAAPRIVTPDVALPWGVPPSIRHGAGLRWLHPPRHTVAAALPWGVPPSVRHAARLPWHCPPRRETQARLPWEQAADIRWVGGVRGTPPPPPAEPWRWRGPRGFAVALPFTCPAPRVRGFAVPLKLGRASCYFAWPRPRTYIMLNSISVVCTLSGHQVEVTSVDIAESLDDAFHSFGFALADPADLEWLVPNTQGPIAVEININGHLYTGIVEDWQTEHALAGKQVSVTGRALSALLDAPYALQRSYVETADRLLVQLVDRELTASGFTSSYDTVDWLVPGGAWHYASQSPMQAIRTLAAASGGVARSHPWEKVIEVLPRYPVSPWNMATTAPDKFILDDYVPRMTGRDATSGSQGWAIDLPLWPASEASKPGLVRPGMLADFAAPMPWRGIVTGTRISASLQQSGNGAQALVVWQSLTVESPPAEPRYNSVLVSGEQVGVSGPVVRTGTAGDKPLPQIIDALITHADAQRERGRNALSAGGEAAQSNLWLSLRGLTPAARPIKGNVMATNGDGSITIATSDGATLRARPLPGQTWANGEGVIVVDGRIVDRAAALPGSTLYV